MIIFKECLKNGVTRFIIDEQHKLFYYRGLKQSLEERRYLIDTCYSSQDRYKELLAYFSVELGVKQPPISIATIGGCFS